MKQSQISTYHTAVAQSRAHRALKTHVSQFLRDHDVTMMQWSVIGLIAEAGDDGMRISDLAKCLDTSLAFITTTVNVLEAKKMVQRTTHSRDSRAKIVSLTPEFKPGVAQIEADLNKKLEEWLFPAISAADMATYIKVLDQIAKND